MLLRRLSLYRAYLIKSIAVVDIMWTSLSIVILFVLTTYGGANASKQRVCVVGAGPGGLISIKNLANYPDEFDIIVFEKESDGGRQWIYTNSTTVDERGLPVHSSIYKHLRWKISLLSLLIMAIGKTNGSKQKVCIIGTGPAGLIATKYIAQHLDQFEPITFEKQSDVGGMWIYSDSTTTDEHGLPVHSSLYKCLRVNGPKEFLTYPDFTKFTAGHGSFISHPLVLEYLRNYTDQFNLRKYIQFDTNVEQVSLTHDDKWHVKMKNLNTNEKNEIICDIFIIGSGHHVKGNIPKIPGIENFSGRILHSHLFRKPEEYAGQSVVVLGAGLSGIDISIQISWNASMVYLSTRHEMLPSVLPENLKQVASIVGADGNELILSDGTRVKADALVFATGYLYDFPYLDESTGVFVEDGKYVRLLHKQFINIEHPTMAILNIPTPSYGFIMPHAQMQYFLAVLRGKITLPSREKMLKDEELPPGKPKSKAHYMLEEMFSYYDDLALTGGGDPLPRYFEPGFRLFYDELIKDPTRYREKNLYVYDDGRAEFY